MENKKFNYNIDDAPRSTEFIAGPKDRYRALIGSAVGSTVEWYDYFLYGTMSATVFGKLFFPSTNAITSQLLALASFALAFLIRPFGGIIFSHIGDRIGRKKTLVITLSLMGLSTVLVGLAPTYASIGVWSPTALIILRLLQGLALGGEWGGGLLLAVEYAPANRRGLYGAVPQVGALVGLALGNFITSGLSMAFSKSAFYSYGWRIPFLLSIVLVLFGLWIRHRIDETPSFMRVREAKVEKKLPLLTTLTQHWRAVLVVIGAKFIETSSFFLFAIFAVSYLIGLHYTRVAALNIVLIGALICIPMMLIYGRLSDFIGRRKMFQFGTVLAMIYILPFFWLMSLGSVWICTLAVIVGFSFIWPIYGALLGTLFAESFPPEVRYTGVSLGYQVGAAIVGGPMPLIATALLAYYNKNYMSVGLFIIACGIVSLVAVSRAIDRTGKPLDDCANVM